MGSLPLISQVSMVHLIFLCLWGGVVATESVLELYPYRRKVLHEHSIRYHFWIDLLVELPLILGVLASGATLAILAWPLSPLHIVKISCAAVAVSANLVCIVFVIRRKQRLDQGASETEMWQATRRIVMCAVVGMPFAAAAAGLGFWLAYHRMLDLLK
jgi:O-antigen/teichoic acid export membrane protein